MCVDDDDERGQRQRQSAPAAALQEPGASKPRAAKASRPGARGKSRCELVDDEASCDEGDDSGFNDDSGFSSDSDSN